MMKNVCKVLQLWVISQIDAMKYINIDTTLNCVYEYPYEIDLDNDKEVDLIFKPFYDTWGHGSITRYGCFIENKNYSLDFLVGLDTNYMDIKNSMDTIRYNNNWLSKHIINLSFTEQTMYPFDYIRITTDSINTDFENKFIGFRIIDNSDTNYYWIKLSASKGCDFYLKELGRKK
jgi:hypothetical protein